MGYKEHIIMTKAKQKYHKLDVNAFSKAVAMLGFVLWVVATIWHGPLGNPSVMGYMYPSFSFVSPINAAMLLAVWIVSFYVIGWLIATFYNWNLRK